MMLLAAALAYLVFAVYGSLVPLDFQPRPLALAWQEFQRIPYLALGAGSRADWVANVLLFIPLGFVWAGVLSPARGGLARAAVGALVWGGCVLLSIAIEFTQLFFPPRTVSQNDVLAEGIGAAIGIAGWWWWGRSLLGWLESWRSARGAASLSERLLWLYLAVLFGYNLLPLDLTVSAVEIYHKWREGRVVLVPFGFVVQDTAEWFYNLATDVLIWAPVSFLWVLSGKKRRFQTWRWTVAAAFMLECLQLFVYSRVSDVTDLLTAMLGAALGVWLARAREVPLEGPRRGGASGAIWLASGGFLVWSAVLAALFWYPYDFTAERELLRERFGLLAQVPFHNYYFGTEFRAVTEVLHKLVFFAPLGMLLAIGRMQVRDRLLGRLLDVGAVLGVAVVAFVIELGQVALPSKHPDTTDWLLALVGGAAGYFGTGWLCERLIVAPDTAARRRPTEYAGVRSKEHRRSRRHGAGHS